MEEAPSHFRYAPDPRHPGWMLWELTDTGRFNQVYGPLGVRAEDAAVRVRMWPERRHSNLSDIVHGGALLGFADMALFAGAHGLGIEFAGPAATLDLSMRFVAGAPTDGGPVDAVLELLRETGRLVFLRGVMMQGDAVITDFTGTIRKPSRPRAAP